MRSLSTSQIKAGDALATQELNGDNWTVIMLLNSGAGYLNTLACAPVASSRETGDPQFNWAGCQTRSQIASKLAGSPGGVLFPGGGANPGDRWRWPPTRRSFIIELSTAEYDAEE
jgi:hypothetical protein